MRKIEFKMYSEKPDSVFIWMIPIEILKDSSGSRRMRRFRTSQDPCKTWRLIISVTKKYYCCSYVCDHCSKNHFETNFITFRLMSKGSTKELSDFKIQLSIINGIEKVFSRSLIVQGERQNYCIINYIDYEELENFLCDGQLQLLVEVFLTKVEKKQQQLESFFQEKFLSDIQLKIGDTSIPAHKVILASKSPYFHKAFSENKQVIDLSFIHSDAFNEILRYMYNGRIENWDLAPKILFGANKLQMDDLKFECEQYLKTNLSLMNVIKFLIEAEKSSAQCLKKYCLTYIRQSFDHVDQMDNFRNLRHKPNLVWEILMEILDKRSETKVISAKGIEYQDSMNESSSDSEFLKGYEFLLDNETLSDVKILVDNREYRSHKVVLAARSSVFRAMLTNNMQESLSNVIEIKDVDTEVFHELLRYMYTGKVVKLKDLGPEILIAADKYDLEHLKTMCEYSLGLNLTVDDVVQILKIADTYNAYFLKERATSFIVEFFMHTDKEEVKDFLISFLVLVRETHAYLLYETLLEICRCYKFAYKYD